MEYWQKVEFDILDISNFCSLKKISLNFWELLRYAITCAIYRTFISYYKINFMMVNISSRHSKKKTQEAENCCN